jgi:hypothetical protein
MQLADLQRQLAASLTGGSAPPAGCAATAIARARLALAAKRRRAVRHLLPRTAASLADRWEDCWRPHCDRYTPSGMLYHVDDAWELAAHLAASRPRAGDRGAVAISPEVRGAAHDDLVSLRLRYARSRRVGGLRIRERRGLVVAWTSTPRRMLVIRLPGRRGLLWHWRVG